MQKKIFLDYISLNLQEILAPIEDSFFLKLEEIRLRINKPLILKNNKEYSINRLSKVLTDCIEQGYIVTKEDLSKTIELMSNFSLYAFENELKNGYITIAGGHRVGISGKTVISGGEVKTISHISGINIRLSHQVIGCADEIMPYIYPNEVKHTMIISPPACGKTTFLRDIIRQLSNIGQTVGLVDERSEIAGAYLGVPQNDIGIRTDILDGCPKAEGMIMLLRSMAPKVIAVDEIGKKEDIHAIDDIISAGVKIICTVHGKSLEELKKREVLSEMLEKKVFERYIILGHQKIQSVYDKNFEEMS